MSIKKVTQKNTATQELHQLLQKFSVLQAKDKQYGRNFRGADRWKTPDENDQNEKFHFNRRIAFAAIPLPLEK